MSFGTDFRTLITSDSSLNAAVEGIYSEHLPDNYDLTKDWIVYSYKIGSQQNCLSEKNLFQTYDLTVRIITSSTVTRESLSNYVINYLNGNFQGNIEDIVLNNAQTALDLEKQIYSDTLSFEAIYV